LGRVRLAATVSKMSDDNKRNDDEKNPKKAGEFRVPPRTMVVWIAILGGIVLLMLFRDKMDTPAKPLISGILPASTQRT